MSELASFKPPDSPSYTRLAVCAFTPWHFVARDVQRQQRADDGAVAVAVGHAEARVVPERVLVTRAEMHAVVGAASIVRDAGAGMRAR